MSLDGPQRARLRQRLDAMLPPQYLPPLAAQPLIQLTLPQLMYPPPPAPLILAQLAELLSPASKPCRQPVNPPAVASADAHVCEDVRRVETAGAEAKGEHGVDVDMGEALVEDGLIQVMVDAEAEQSGNVEMAPVASDSFDTGGTVCEQVARLHGSGARDRPRRAPLPPAPESSLPAPRYRRTSYEGETTGGFRLVECRWERGDGMPAGKWLRSWFSDVQRASARTSGWE